MINPFRSLGPGAFNVELLLLHPGPHDAEKVDSLLMLHHGFTYMMNATHCIFRRMLSVQKAAAQHFVLCVKSLRLQKCQDFSKKTPLKRLLIIGVSGTHGKASLILKPWMLCLQCTTPRTPFLFHLYTIHNG